MFNLTPYIVETTPHGEKLMDVFSRLMRDRIIYFGAKVDSQTANTVIAQLLYLDSQSQEPITMYINSPGGVVDDGMAIYDTMNLIKAPVHTVCVGLCASMGAMLLSNGKKGSRKILPHSRVMIHQPLGGAQGQASDIEIGTKQILAMKNTLIQRLAENTGQKLSKVKRDADRDYWMNAEQAVKYGIVDEIVGLNP